MAKNTVLTILLGFSCALLVACGGSGGGNRYSIKQDHGPSSAMDPNKISDAIPRDDPILKAGNKSPYTVLGKTYYLLPTAKDYKAIGGASWYGKKFHGHTTSNGEIYDMYGMTAAHKTLPIPSYVKVTNLSNGKSTIVRVNDRGPFHPGRIIDLSYAAATKLGYIGNGTATVEVEAIDVKTYAKSKPKAVAKPAKIAKQTNKPKNAWLEVDVFADYQQASDLQHQLVEVTDKPVIIDRKNTAHRVKIGPLANASEADEIIALLLLSDLGRAVLIHE